MNRQTVVRTPLRYRDRREAGIFLADRLRHLAGRDDVVVLGLPRGGVPVAYEIAKALDALLDVFVVRKIGLPGHPEYAIGAIATGGVRILNEDLVRAYHLAPAAVEQVVRAEQRELERRELTYRGARPPLALEDRVVILVDDGLATGSSMRAAVIAVRKLLPAQLIVAVPVGSPQACVMLDQVADDVICARTPDLFNAVGLWYEDFGETSDDEVKRLLAAGNGHPALKRSA